MSRRSWMSRLEQRHQKRLRTSDQTSRKPVDVPGGRTTLLVGVAVLYALLASPFIVNEVQRAREGVEAPAVVVKRRSGKYDYVDVVFTTSTGRRVRASVGNSDWREVPKVGARVRVRYVPSRPESTAIDAERPRGAGIFVPALLLFFSSIFAIHAVIDRRRTRRTRFTEIPEP